jgi:hypothetical protein
MMDIAEGERDVCCVAFPSSEVACGPDLSLWVTSRDQRVRNREVADMRVAFRNERGRQLKQPNRLCLLTIVIMVAAKRAIAWPWLSAKTYFLGIMRPS